MEKTFESERARIHDGFEMASKQIEMNLSIKYDPTHRAGSRILIAICNAILRLAGSKFRVKFIVHDGE